ncbi:MAG: nicotinamide mononucleotide transporter [Candidatus Heimdallarchaeota archaeon]|nr:nicotinamide mononucleotide transporter [Candidatus Heimdallarchaeota archaeon]
MQRIFEYFHDWTIWERIWLLSFSFLILGLSIIWQDTWIGILTSITGIWCVVLVAKGRISNYYFGIINVILYAYLAYGWMYYGEVMLNLFYFLPMQFWGIWQWTRPDYKKSSDEVFVNFLSNKQRIIVAVVSISVTFFYGLVLQYIGGSLPFFDASSTVLSIIAMILMVRAYMEQWVLWILVNIVSIWLWIATLLAGGNDITILLMWTAYLINAMYGWWNWVILYRTQER